MSRMIVDPWLLSPVVNATTLKTIKHSVEMRSLSLSAPTRPRKLKIRGHVRQVYGWGTWIRTKACTLYASLLADEKRERNCVALEAVSSRPEIQCRGEGAPVVIPARFPEDVRADFRAQNRLDFRRIVRIGVVMGWPSQSRPLKGSPCDLRGFGSCERQVRRREPTEPKRCRPFP